MVGRSPRAPAAAAGAVADGASPGAGARDEYAAGLAARAAIEADITITHDATPPDADGATLDELVMTWRGLTWRRKPQPNRALDHATLGILVAAWDAADTSHEREQLRRARRQASRERRDDSDRRVRQRREDDDQQRSNGGARPRRRVHLRARAPHTTRPARTRALAHPTRRLAIGRRAPLSWPAHLRLEATRVSAGSNRPTQSSQCLRGPSFCVGRPVGAERAGARTPPHTTPASRRPGSAQLPQRARVRTACVPCAL